MIAENQAEGGDYTAISSPDGTFHIEGIVPGRYRLFVERTGFLEVDKHRTQTDGRVLTLTAGQELNDLRIRLRAAAVGRGHVTDEDGEPMPGAQVAGFARRSPPATAMEPSRRRRPTTWRIRRRWSSAGNCPVSVAPPPDFKSLIEGAGAAAANDSNSASTPERTASTSYQTTYYPGTPDRSQAAPIQVHAGDEFPC